MALVFALIPREDIGLLLGKSIRLLFAILKYLFEVKFARFIIAPRIKMSDYSRLQEVLQLFLPFALE